MAGDDRHTLLQERSRWWRTIRLRHQRSEESREASALMSSWRHCDNILDLALVMSYLGGCQHSHDEGLSFVVVTEFAKEIVPTFLARVDVRLPPSIGQELEILAV
jgi:hypothetical protein